MDIDFRPIGQPSPLVCRACGFESLGLGPGVLVVPLGDNRFALEHEHCPAERDDCALCGRAWHPATGFLVGSPQTFPACGPCSRALLKFMQDMSGRRVRGYEFYEFIRRPGPDVLPTPRKSKHPPKWQRST